MGVQDGIATIAEVLLFPVKMVAGSLLEQLSAYCSWYCRMLPLLHAADFNINLNNDTDAPLGLE